MAKLIEFQNSTIKLNEKVLMKGLKFVVEENKHVSLIGPSASGKTTILKALAKIAEISDLYLLERMEKRVPKSIYEIVAVVINDTNFICESIRDELAFGLKNKSFSQSAINEKIKLITDYFNFEEYLEFDPELLSYENKILLKILSYLIIEPKVIAIDDLFIYLNNNLKNKIMKYISDFKITLLLATSDIEDTIFTDYIYILSNMQIIAEGPKENIYKEEKLLNRIGYGLPFIVDLSTQLTYYDLVDRIYLSNEELVDNVWK